MKAYLDALLFALFTPVMAAAFIWQLAVAAWERGCDMFDDFERWL